MTLVPELAKIRDEITAASEQASAVCAGLSDEQLAWRPRPNSWSIAECLKHLNLTTQVCLPALDNAIEAARAQGKYSDGPFSLSVMGRIFARYVEPPPLIRLPAPKVLRPLVTGSVAEVLPQFLRSQEVMLVCVERANGLDLNRVRYKSPFASFVRMDLLAFFHVFTGHERRHLWQAGNVRREIESRP